MHRLLSVLCWGFRGYPLEISELPPMWLSSALEIPAALFSLDSWLQVRLASPGSPPYTRAWRPSQVSKLGMIPGLTYFLPISQELVSFAPRCLVSWKTTVSCVFVSCFFRWQGKSGPYYSSLFRNGSPKVYPLVFVLEYLKMYIFSRWYVCVFTKNLAPTSVPTTLIVSSQITMIFPYVSFQGYLSYKQI